jgi:dipeptidyl aminopeptidase/acylaminoacyl peptidase
MRRLMVAISALVFVASASLAQTPVTASNELAVKFGALESISQISLSPDGTKIAFVGQVEENSAIFVAELFGGGTVKPILGAGGGKFSWCSWATDARLVCQVRAVVSNSGLLLGFSRMLAIDADGKREVKLTKDTSWKSLGMMQNGGGVLDWDVAGQPGKLLMTQEYVPEVSIGSNIKKDDEGLGVDLVDSVTLRRSRIEQPRRNAVEYISDGKGTVRIMGIRTETSLGYDGNTVGYHYRKPGSRAWDKLSVVGLADNSVGGFEPVAVDSAKNVVYGFDEDNGMTALFSIALDGTGKRRLVLGRQDVDIDSLVTIGRDRRVVGASYATERRMIEYFDPELKSLSAALSKALPGKPNVDFIDASADEAKLLLLAWSDTNPGMFYLFDKKTRELHELLPVRPELAGALLAEMKPVVYSAGDGTQIPAYLTLQRGSTGKGLPAIVMPHGGPGSRDEWGFDWLVQYFAARGFAVLQPNFRGSTGYGSAWYQQNGFKSWRIAIGDVNDAGRWLVSQGIAAPDKLGIVGWSYGGYAALQSSVLDPALFKGIVAIAPVTDLERLRQDAESFSHFPLVDAFIGKGPHVREGSPAQNVARFRAPVLLFHGTKDQNVGVGHSKLIDDRLRSANKPVTYVEFPGLGHSLHNAKARARLLTESDAFLRKAFGMPAQP